MPAWVAHLRTFVTGDGSSYLERKGGKDHFVASGRVWHPPSPVMSFGDAVDYARGTSGHRGPRKWRWEDCDDFATNPKLVNVQKLLPEAQNRPPAPASARTTGLLARGAFVRDYAH